MKKKGMSLSSKIYITILTLFVLTFLQINLSSAAITTISPLNGSNSSSANLVLFNVTFVNGTDILIRSTAQTQVNASFYSISGSTRSFVTNSSTCAVSSGTTFACWTKLSLSSSNDGFFNITATIFNLTSSVNASINTTSIYFDSSPPQVSVNNFTSPTIGSNYSSTLQLSVSIIDPTIGINYVFFNITNSSGQQNSTIVASNSAGNVWNASIDTRDYPEGLYNITVYVNDSLNNINNSARIYSMYFDNTAPSASVSCSPDYLQQEQTTTCSCSGSDALTGISSVSIDSNPSTSQTGRFTSSCSVIDTAGNTGTGSTTYVVVSESGSGGGGGGAGLSPPSNQQNGNSEQEASNPSTSTTQGSEDGQVGAGSSAAGKGILGSNIVLIIVILVAVMAAIVIIFRNKK